MSDFAQVMNREVQSGLRFRGVYIEGTYSDLGTYGFVQSTPALQNLRRLEDGGL